MALNFQLEITGSTEKWKRCVCQNKSRSGNKERKLWFSSQAKRLLKQKPRLRPIVQAHSLSFYDPNYLIKSLWWCEAVLGLMALSFSLCVIWRCLWKDGQLRILHQYLRQTLTLSIKVIFGHLKDLIIFQQDNTLCDVLQFSFHWFINCFQMKYKFRTSLRLNYITWLRRINNQDTISK